MSSHSKKAFTLVELLVVVAIIVILIAILIPALDGAQYQANLAVCMTNQRGIAGGAILYTSSNKGLYPYRPTLALVGVGWRRFNVIYDPGDGTPVTGRPPADDRIYFKDYIQLKMLTDPMGGQIDMSEIPPTAWGFPNYELWFGAKFSGQSGLLRSTDRLTFEGQRFNVIVSDEDKILSGINRTHCSHPDDLRVQPFTKQVDTTIVISRYDAPATYQRGPIDFQFANIDGSGHRIAKARWDEWSNGGRMVKAPIVNYDNDVSATWGNLPKN